jgi:phthiodiolone/phenolphthiodiolone dimycocerosates ketoreductase
MRISWQLYGYGGIAGIVEEATLCQQYGFDGVWYPDYQAPFSNEPELYVVLTSLAHKTKSILIGSMITDVLRRHPMVTAHSFASLSHIAPGRLVLGLGAGGATSHLPYGINMDNLRSKLEEGIIVIRKLWMAKEKEPANFKGAFFSLIDAGSPLHPVGVIPIYIAAYGPRMLRLTAKYGDGWLPESHTPDSYKITSDNLRRLIEDFDRDPDKFEMCLGVIFYPFETDEYSYKRLLEGAKHYLATYPDILWIEGYSHPGLRTHQIVVNKELWDKLARDIPNDLADETIVYGNAEDCVDKISRFYDAGCKHIILEPYWIERDRLFEAISITGTKIIPKLP